MANQRPHVPELDDIGPGYVWRDPVRGHRVACIDAADPEDVHTLMRGDVAALAIQDPPYNQVTFEMRNIEDYVRWCEKWVDNTLRALASNASLYVWMGADQNNGFQPLPDFIIMMRTKSAKPRSFITLRNQRGYGTQKNWMAVRQELLYYVKGNPVFHVQYTNIPKKTRGYYKMVNGNLTENLERGKADCIRPGNVWGDIQQVFYRLEENVKSCYAQKPLRAIERIITASSNPEDLIIDFFAHSGTTLLQAEISGRRCFTGDIDPTYCYLTIQRLLRYRETGLTGWQNEDPLDAANSRQVEKMSLF